MPPHYAQRARWLFAAFVIELAWADASPAADPTFATMPTVSAPTLVADDTTEYTVSMKVSDGNGYDDIRCLRTMFGYSEAGGDPSRGRGYLAWGKSDGDITQYGGTWAIIDAAGGGRWGCQTDAWGGTTYITPLSCSLVVAGKNAGGTGSRTVTWTFRAKPAWASNPVVNDADAWAADGRIYIGWRDNPAEFDVVPAACTSYATTPLAPIVSNATETSIDVSVDPAESNTDLFAIRASPEYNGLAWVQADGTLGKDSFWQTKAAWGTTTVTGLAGSLSYSLSLRAMGAAAGICPSAYGPSASATTLVASHAVQTDAIGVPVKKQIIGHATRLDAYPDHGGSMDRVWEIVGDSSVRGIAGGLDADTYNWKDMSGQGVGHTGTPGPDEPTTLMWMRRVRDHQPATPIITVNCRGTGPLESSGYCRFYYSDTTLPPLVTLAADWVRYVNFILPAYREGDALPPAHQAVLDSINWYGRPKLLTPGEATTPPVAYWEIGNEPELAQPSCTAGAPMFSLTSAEYVSRYKSLTEAMRSVDPTIKVGPCTIDEPYSLALMSDPAARVDFVSYHQYGPLYWYAKAYGDTAASAESGLRSMKQSQMGRYTDVRNNIASAGRDPDAIPLIISEWNPSSWEWETKSQARRMAHALGVAETVFTFAELQLLAAQYWSFPTVGVDTTEAPGYRVFQMLRQHLGDTLVSSYSDGLNFRLYVTRDSATDDLAVWALNFSEFYDKTMRLCLSGLDLVDTIRLKKLANLTGDSSLLDRNDTPTSILVDWTEQTLTGIDLNDFMMTFEDATITILVIEQTPPVKPDFDRDGDVDQDDFGHLQVCLSGPLVPQTAPACQNARLDADGDVDQNDWVIFSACVSGAGVRAEPTCSQ